MDDGQCRLGFSTEDQGFCQACPDGAREVRVDRTGDRINGIPPVTNGGRIATTEVNEHSYRILIRPWAGFDPGINADIVDRGCKHPDCSQHY